MASIQFFSEEIDFTVSRKAVLREWIQTIADQEGATLTELNVIFCSDDYLLNLNQKYLDRDYLTDVITFDQSDSDSIQGDIYISVPRVQENANIYQKNFSEELARVIIHGVLHLLGYRDHTDKEKAAMRKKEEASLSLLP